MICVRDLTKRYGSNLAVKGISFQIEEGKIYGFLGPNGAGKSTTMNIITGCLAPSEGEVVIDDIDTFEDPKGAKKLLGYLPEQPPVYGDMTPAEYLSFVGKAKGLKGQSLDDGIDYVMEKTAITEVADRLIRNLSKGYRQRVGIAQAMLADPKYIILDEPTVGLDPRQIIGIRTLIRELAEEHTVILSSHILAEVQEVCDELIVIAGGRIAAVGTMDEITRSIGADSRMHIVARNISCDPGVLADIQGIVRIDAEPITDTEVSFTLTFERESDIREAVFHTLTEAGAVILEMHTDVPTLESVFLGLTEARETVEEQEELAPSVAEAAQLLSVISDTHDDPSQDDSDDSDGDDGNDNDDTDGDSYKPLFS